MCLRNVKKNASNTECKHHNEISRGHLFCLICWILTRGFYTFFDPGLWGRNLSWTWCHTLVLRVWLKTNTVLHFCFNEWRIWFWKMLSTHILQTPAEKSVHITMTEPLMFVYADGWEVIVLAAEQADIVPMGESEDLIITEYPCNEQVTAKASFLILTKYCLPGGEHFPRKKSIR